MKLADKIHHDPVTIFKDSFSILVKKLSGKKNPMIYDKPSDERNHGAGPTKKLRQGIMDESHGIYSSGVAEPWEQGYGPATIRTDVSPYQNDSFKAFGNQISTVESMKMKMLFMALGTECVGKIRKEKRSTLTLINIRRHINLKNFLHHEKPLKKEYGLKMTKHHHIRTVSILIQNLCSCRINIPTP
jgi:hypothetical protein